jgi:hypothetical protein
MDFRPIDTTATITTRNLIRVGAITQLCLVVVYLSVEPYFNGAHMSWLHQMHILLQPLVIFVSVSDSSVITMASIFIVAAAALFDGVVTWLNYISITRCLNEPSATCFELVWEKGIWFLLGAWVFLNDVLLVLRLLTLQKVLSKKDTHEKASKEDYDSLSIKPAPVLKTMEVHNAKLRIIHTFLIPSGVLYTFFMVVKAFESPLYWITLGHLLLDLYGMGVSKVHDRASLIITLALTIIFAGTNVFGLVMRMSTPNETLVDELSYLISVLYVFCDSLIVFFSISNLNLMSQYDKLKKN